LRRLPPPRAPDRAPAAPAVPRPGLRAANAAADKRGEATHQAAPSALQELLHGAGPPAAPRTAPLRSPPPAPRSRAGPALPSAPRPEPRPATPRPPRAVTSGRAASPGPCGGSRGRERRVPWLRSAEGLRALKQLVIKTTDVGTLPLR